MEERRVDEEKVALIGQTKLCPKCNKLVSSAGFDWKHHMTTCDADYFAHEIESTYLDDGDDVDETVLRCLASKHIVPMDTREPIECTACGDDALTDDASIQTPTHPDIPGCPLCSDCHDRVIDPSTYTIASDDGKEEQCRWCGKGGNLIVCDDCPRVFCSECIERNLGKDAQKDLFSDDADYAWRCYCCDPSQVAHLNLVKPQQANAQSKHELSRAELADQERQKWLTTLMPFQSEFLEQLFVPQEKTPELSAAMRRIEIETRPHKIQAMVDAAMQIDGDAAPKPGRHRKPRVYHKQKLEPLVAVAAEDPKVTFNPLLTEVQKDGCCCGCGSGSDLSQALGSCEGCDAKWHAACIGIDSFPDDLPWFCPQCQVNKQHKQRAAQLKKMEKQKAAAGGRAAARSVSFMDTSRQDANMESWMLNNQPMHRFGVVPGQTVVVESLAIARYAACTVRSSRADLQPRDTMR